MYSASRWYTHLDRLWVIIYISFGTNQPPFSLKEQLFSPWSRQIWEMRIKHLVTIKYLFIKYHFRPILCWLWLPWRRLLFSYALWLLKISFLCFKSSHWKVSRNIFSWNKCKSSSKRYKSLLHRCWKSIKYWGSSCLFQFPYDLF